MRRSRGFTLLEVLVAIAILGLGMTAILSAQAGLFASSLYAGKVSVAAGIVRCKMSELELKLSKEGYPLTDMNDEGPCCAEESPTGYRCKWKIEKVELPPPPLSSDLSTRMGGIMSSLGSVAGIAAVGQTNGSVLGNSPQLGDVSKLLAGQTALPQGTGLSALGAPSASAGSTDSDFGKPFGATSFGKSVDNSTTPEATPGAGMGASSLAPLVMMLVYPSLKPMLEASIRKVTVTAVWKTGEKEQTLEVVQLLTNPMQGGLDPNAAAGLDAAFSALGGLFGGGTGAPGAAPAGGAPK